ncbi:MarR family transcriptional regulator [Pseudomaricurvus alkylphenolicus]|jgi:DNA-binding MarR family transcriptional regulator|uniref:MarR family winged helix-turn-helix transcriptional regulator n=1 Tax=Pseudomaricurvus alkylphenolicus TaxID=1306991 RepID=UPI0014225B35|nr:MarR family transcriptional regulator [Pseudomaricurvus alkylphenolicus]NIB41157.1 MarR family transcriptional regulator [Pseudomaricurvus alkylphenolicus]
MTFALNQSYTYWISRLANLLQESFNRELQTLDVTWPQWMVVNTVSRGVADTPAEVARQLGVDRSAVTRLLDRLEKKGLLQRQHSQQDRRSVTLSMTPGGALMVEHMDEAAERHQRDILATLPESEQQMLKLQLSRLLRELGVESRDTWKSWRSAR